MCCLFSLFSYAQSKEEVERVKKESISLYDEGKYDKAIAINQRLIKESREVGYIKGIMSGYKSLSYIMRVNGKYHESLAFVELWEKENERNYDKGEQSIIYSEKAALYSYLDLYQQSISYSKKSLALSTHITDKKARQNLRAFCYGYLAIMYNDLNKLDSSFYYSKKAFYEQDNIEQSNRLAFYYIYYKNDFDSAAYYLKYSESKIKAKEPHAYELSLFYRTLGDYYKEKKEYDSAIIYYNKLLQIGIERKILVDVKNAYLFISEAAELSNDKEMAAKFLKKYNVLSDSLSRSQKIQLNYPIEQYIKESQKEYKHQENISRYKIVATALLSVLVLLFFLIRNRKKAVKLKNTLKNKEELIVEREQETNELKSKVKDGFEEVTLLARKNKPEFVTRFIEIYPEFYQVLLKLYPDIPPETLKFCALLKLNFSTKEIADYNFLTIRAIQLRKNRLRKKLNIPSSEDIYVWINNLDKKTKD